MKHLRPDKPWEVFVAGLLICAGAGAFVYAVMGMYWSVH